MQDVTYSRVLELLAETANVPAERLEPGTDLQGLGLDSLVMLEIGLALEKEYEVEFDDAAVAQAQTIGELVDLVRRTTAAVTG